MIFRKNNPASSEWMKQHLVVGVVGDDSKPKAEALRKAIASKYGADDDEPWRRTARRDAGAYKRNPQNGYIAFFKGLKTEIYADSLYAAKLKAIAYFTPPKKMAHMVHVELAELGGKQVTSVITNPHRVHRRARGATVWSRYGGRDYEPASHRKAPKTPTKFYLRLDGEKIAEGMSSELERYIMRQKIDASRFSITRS